MKEILHQVRELLAEHNNDFVLTSWQDREAMLGELDEFLSVEELTPEHMDRLRLLFAANGSLQALSISGGWTEEFLKLSSQFEKLA